MNDASHPRPGAIAAQLVAASFVALFLELTLIRWIPVQVRAIAYFPNVVLISAFLGLGIGCLRAGKRSLLWLLPTGVLLLTAVAAVLSRVAFTQESASEHLWLLYYDLPKNAPVVPSVRLPVVLFFALTALAFVPLGQFIAERLREFREIKAPLRGYAADLLGSLIGVVGFAAMSLMATNPLIWFTTLLLAGTLLVMRDRRILVVYAVCALATLFVVIRSERAAIYSPYYALRVTGSPGGGFNILTNGSLHQTAMPLRRNDTQQFPSVNLTRAGYHIPYGLLKRPPQRVLILGAGSGNDVAVALDEGAQQIDAVEIDPVILRIGTHHPDNPYSSPRVHAYNMDARAFLNHNTVKYDLIIFGTLDSMTRLSALSSVRLDNFVYTTDSIRAARRHLTPDGGIVMYFMVSRDFIQDHIRAMISLATGELPITVPGHHMLFNRIYLSGPAFAHLPPFNRQLSSAALSQLADNVDAPTDDWPYLYLEQRSVSPFYLSLVGILLLLAAGAVFLCSPEMRESLRTGFDAEMFLFGLAFLLLETKLVTEMNLLWGATWLTSAVVFGSILLMILAGTLFTEVRRIPWSLAATGLIVTLLATYFVSIEPVVGSGAGVRLLFSLAFIGLPILFASICFAILFEGRPRPEVAFGWNMLGAVAGGLLEFSSMAIGIKATTLLALAAYLIALLVRQRKVAAIAAATS
jgi:hypothetical protein